MLSATKVTECEDTDWGSPRVTGRIGGSSRRRKQRGLRREVATATCSPLLSAAASVTFYFDVVSNLDKIHEWYKNFCIHFPAFFTLD